MNVKKMTLNEESFVPPMKLFAGERLLTMLGLLGLTLAAVVAVYIGIWGGQVLPEGDLSRAFSFDAALGIFFVSIAAILPLSGINERNRKKIRLLFVGAGIYAYGEETIQHFRGINPRFSEVGTLADALAGILLGVDSLLLIVLTVLIAIPFFRREHPSKRPLLVLGIRYAFLSTMLAFVGGVGMIILQSRFTGASGNLIVLHGVGFHALQTLPLLGWLLEKTNSDVRRAQRLIHIGSTAWMIAVVLIGLQTALGLTVFEPSALPLLAGAMLLVSLLTIIIAAIDLGKRKLDLTWQAANRA